MKKELTKEQRDAKELELLKKLCDTYVATYTPGYINPKTGQGVKGFPTKGGFLFQVSQLCGIKPITVRKWKQMEDPRYDLIDEVYEFIKARVEDAWLNNGGDRVQADAAAKYYQSVFNSGNQELAEKDKSAEIIINISGKDPFEDGE